MIRNVCNWKISDLQQILVEGDKSYKSLNIQNDLNVEKLPGKKVVFFHTVTLEISEENLHEGIVVQRKPF